MKDQQIFEIAQEITRRYTAEQLLPEHALSVSAKLEALKLQKNLQKAIAKRAHCASFIANMALVRSLTELRNQARMNRPYKGEANASPASPQSVANKPGAPC
jgi:hypothetical protein